MVLNNEMTTISGVEVLHYCPICGSKAMRVLPAPGNWIGPEVFDELSGKLGLMRCLRCTLTFTNPRPSQDLLTNFYSGNTYTCHELNGSASSGTKAQYILDKLESCVPASAPKTLLDYGTGSGAFLLHAQQRGWSAIGFEPGARGLANCVAHGLKVTDAVDTLPSHHFGLITLHHVFEHLANPNAVLDTCKRLLAPGGRLFLEVPNLGSLRARLAVPALSKYFRVDERYRAFPIHLMYYTKRTLSRTLSDAGWTCDATYTFGMGMDEFIVQKQPKESEIVSSKRTAQRYRLRHLFRDLFLQSGLGENLAVVAHNIEHG